MTNDIHGMLKFIVNLIEIKGISKIQKRERVKDSVLGTETTQISNITDEYCKLVMNQVGLLV